MARSKNSSGSQDSDQPADVLNSVPEAETTADMLGDAVSEALHLEEPVQGVDPFFETEIVASEIPPFASIPPAVTKKSSGGFLPTVLGGVVAAGLGFGLAQYVPQGWPMAAPAPQKSGVQATLADQTARLDALSADVAAMAKLPIAVADTNAIDGVETRVKAIEAGIAEHNAGLAQQLTQQADAVAALDARIVALELRPVAGGAASDTAVSAYSAELQALRTMIEEQKAQSAGMGSEIAAVAAEAQAKLESAQAQAAALQAQTEAAATAATARAAVLRVQAALETGGSFSTALNDLESVGISAPDSLRTSAEGIPTLPDLQIAFMEPARTALAVSVKATVGDGWMDRMGGFLRNQVGARSLTAQEGTSPDAILSRAEDAVGRGALPDALAEIAALPAEGQAEMQAWVALVQTRIDTQTAVETLANSLNN